MPTIKHARTGTKSQPISLAKLAPAIKPEKAKIDKMIEMKSTFGLVIWPTFAKLNKPMTKAITKNRTNVKKMSRQVPTAKINPVKVGPIAGANIITKARTPLTVPNLLGGKINIAIVNINGKMIPVPIP